MRIIITENQLGLLNKSSITESDELNQYGLTTDEMRQIEEDAEEQTKKGYELFKKEVEDLRQKVKSYSNFDLSLIDKVTKKMIMDNVIQPDIDKLQKYEKSLSEFDFDEYKQKMIDWNLYSSGGIGYKFRYQRYKDEALNRNLTKQDIIDLFVTSLEGGSNYWYYMDLPKNIKSFGEYTSESVGEYIMQGGAIQFYDIDEYNQVEENLLSGGYNINGDVIDQNQYNEDLENAKLGYVDMDKVLEAITILKKEYPEVWESILLEQSDAGDADIFLQLCVMGDVVYG